MCIDRRTDGPTEPKDFNVSIPFPMYLELDEVSISSEAGSLHLSIYLWDVGTSHRERISPDWAQWLHYIKKNANELRTEGRKNESEFLLIKTGKKNVSTL